MTESHEAIEELLSGYVLRSLSGEDAALADQLLSDHVPSCAACRDSLAVFQGLTADLALDAAPMAPPDTLLPRLHRELGAQQGARRRPIAVFAVAAGVVAVVGLASLSVAQGVKAGHTQTRMNGIAQALDFARQQGASMVQVASSRSNTGPITEISKPGVQEFFLVGRDLPTPPDGAVYRVWLLSGPTATFAKDFVPAPGLTVVPLEFDPGRFDGILISVEPVGSAPQEPHEEVWKTAS
ncbi:MAG: anti-sigma factor domain-containing protein [Actinomycetota bacterium]